MTIIVADAAARLMVADTLVVCDDVVHYYCPKIVRCKGGALAGAAGEGPDCLTFLNWARQGCVGKVENFPQASGILLTKKGELRFYEGSGQYDVVPAGFMAIGSGAPAARGARACGASAEDCVKAACAVSIYCGGEIQIEHL